MHLACKTLHKWRQIADGRKWQISELKIYTAPYENISWHLALLDGKCFKKQV